MLLTVEKIIHETEDAVSVVFNKPRGIFNRFKYKPGQFMTLKILIGNKIQNRSYSLSSSPWLHEFLRITVKKVEGGLVSNYICNDLKEGQKIEIDKPTGEFYIDPKKKVSQNYVLFAGGSGITPIYSIIISVLEKEPKSTILLVYANRNEKSIIFQSELEEIESKYSDRISIVYLLDDAQENLKANYHKERLNDIFLDKILKNKKMGYNQGKFMLCGPQGFMDAAVAILEKKGVSKNKIQLEAFTADLNKLKEQSESAVSSTVTVTSVGAKDVLQVEKGKTILQAALDSNIEIPYSCRSGMCSSCMAKCTSGNVKMMEGHLLPENEVNDGYILTCVAFPQSEEVEIILPQ